jgi:tetratricopeptide (TPR) repeat protein
LPGPLVPEPPFPFVGRAEELGTVRALLQRAESGEGAVAAVVADAGGGKTRLAREFAHEAAARGALVLYGASDAAVRTPYGPLRQWLDHLARGSERELGDCLDEGGAILARLVPAVAAVTGVAAPPPADAEGDRYLLQQAAIRLLRELAGTRPVVAVADDVHWADDETLHLLRALARAAPEVRLLLVIAYRDRAVDTRPEAADALADLWRLEGVTRIGLGSLGDDDVATFVREAASAEASAELVASIGELTGGTPLLVCELWRELLATGGVETSDAGVRLVRAIDDVRGPERIADAVRQRLGRLDARVGAVVELAAVAGPTFELEVLAGAGADDGTAVASALDQAVAGGFVEELPTPTGAFRFTHELVRRAVYDRLGGLRRAELHLRVGEALERAHAADLSRIVPELASHFTLAAAVAGPARGIDYNLRAAEAAVDAAAFADAADRLSSALALGIPDDQARTRAQIELAYVLRGLGRHVESEATLAPILDGPAEADAATAVRAAQARYLRLMGDPAADPEGMRREAEHAVETFGRDGDTYRLAVARRHLGLACRRQGRLADAVAVLGAAFHEAEASGREDARRQIAGSLAYALCDGPTPVADALDRCERLRGSGDSLFAAIVDQFFGVLLAMAGRPDEARRRIEECDDFFSTRYAAAGTGRAIYQVSVAEGCELLGEPAHAERRLTAKWELWQQSPDFAVDGRAMHAAYHLALLCCDEGRWEDAERWAGYAHDVPVPGYFLHEAVLGLAARARVAAHRGDLDRALELARTGIDLVETSDMSNLRARTWLALAEVRRARGETVEAAAAAETALHLYEAKGNVAAVARMGVPRVRA